MNYDLVIIGATASALGLAKTVKKNLKILILNKTEMVVYEFVNTYKMPGVYSNGAVYYEEFRKLDADVLLKTDVIDIKRDNNKYKIEIFNSAGFQTVETEIIVDTTTERNVKILRKSLNCLLVNPCGTHFPKIESNGVEFIEDSNETYSTIIMKYGCDVERSIHEVRHQLIDFWRNKEDLLLDWKIASIGFCFEEIPAFELHIKDEKYILAPSAYFDSPTASVDAGAALGRSLIA